MPSITVTADTDTDPYSALWSDLTSAEIEAVEQHFVDQDGWTWTTDLADVRVEPLLVHIDAGDHAQRIYLPATSELLDTAADSIERILGRQPDSLS
jgi:hypothetical protein